MIPGSKILTIGQIPQRFDLESMKENYFSLLSQFKSAHYSIEKDNEAHKPYRILKIAFQNVKSKESAMMQLDNKILQLDSKVLVFLNPSEFLSLRHFDLILCENDAPVERYSIKIVNIPKSSAVYERTFIRLFPEEIKKETFWEKFEESSNLEIYLDFANAKLRDFCFAFLKERMPEEKEFEEDWKDKHTVFEMAYPEQHPYTAIVFVS